MQTKSNFKRAIYRIIPRKENVLHLMFSFIIACLLWFSVTEREQSELSFEVRLDYVGLPDNLILRDNLQNYASIRLKGSSQLLSRLDGKTLTHAVDLTNIENGANLIQLDFGTSQEFEDFEIMSVQPTQLVVVSEKIAEKEVPLELLLVDSTEVKNGFITKDIKLLTDKVTAKGAESLISQLTRLLVPFNPPTSETTGVFTQSVAIIIPPLVEVNTPIVTVSYEVEREFKEVSLSKDIVIVTDEDTSLYTFKKQKVKVKLEIPKVLENEEEILAQLQVIAQPSGISEETVNLEINLPEHFTILEMKPETVKIQKSAQ